MSNEIVNERCSTESGIVDRVVVVCDEADGVDYKPYHIRDSA